MIKKTLFVLLVGVALLAIAGSGVPTASADCSAATNCNPMFGPNFVTTQTVGAPANPIASPLFFTAPLTSTKGILDLEFITLEHPPAPPPPVVTTIVTTIDRDQQ